MLKKTRKIGEILIENGYITKEILDMALEYQSRHGGTLTQYLLSGGYIKEEDLARCISIQYGYPYLPLRAYDIPHNIVRMIEPDIARKYWLMPVDKIGNILTLVMADPLDEEATREVEKATGCTVQSFVGTISDITKAIERYYGVKVEDKFHKKEEKESPLFIETKKYSGPERRRSVRIKAHIEVHFPLQGLYEKSVTKDVSMNGFLFNSKNILPIRSLITLEIDLPSEFCSHPLAAVVRVVRAMPLRDGTFDIGVELIDMPKEDLNRIIQYAMTKNKGS